jgi:hypothetical protein
MKIAKFDSNSEMNEVYSTMKANFSAYLPVWIGGNDIVKTGTWRWAPDDSPVFITLSNESDKIGGLNCLYLYTPSRYNSTIYNANCADSRYFICQK